MAPWRTKAIEAGVDVIDRVPPWPWPHPSRRWSMVATLQGTEYDTGLTWPAWPKSPPTSRGQVRLLRFRYGQRQWIPTSSYQIPGGMVSLHLPASRTPSISWTGAKRCRACQDLGYPPWSPTSQIVGSQAVLMSAGERYKMTPTRSSSMCAVNTAVPGAD